MSDEQETSAWERRRSAVREKFWEKIVKPLGDPLDQILDEATTPPPSGDVPSAPATGVDSSATADAPPSGFSDTSVTATEASATPPSPPSPSMPAASTSSSSDVSTAWTVPLSGWVENNLKQTIVDPSGLLLPGLSPKAQKSLAALAIGNNQSEADMVQQIAEWFLQEEDERAEGPLIDAIEWYVANYTL